MVYCSSFVAIKFDVQADFFMNKILIYQVPQAHKWLKVLTQLSYMPGKTWILYNDLQ